MTLLGLSEEPASLDGYGPIDPDTAHRLCANAPGFYRLLTHPETGVVLPLGRDKYRIPRRLRRWLAVRDKTCRANTDGAQLRRRWHGFACAIAMQSP